MAPIKRISRDKISRIRVSDIEIGTVRAFIAPSRTKRVEKPPIARILPEVNLGTSAEIRSRRGTFDHESRIIDETARNGFKIDISRQ